MVKRIDNGYSVTFFLFVRVSRTIETLHVRSLKIESDLVNFAI